MALHKTTFVLVHGSWHAGWCFDRLRPLLQASGHTVIAPDLPGHGDDQTPPKDVTLRSYTDLLQHVLEGCDDQAILVGHSRGGIVISQVAEYAPSKIRALVYLAAFLIPNGQTMIDAAMSDTESLIIKNLEINEAEGWHMLKREAARDALYHDCRPADVDWAVSQLQPEPNAPVATPLSLSEENFGRVRRVYIECLDDRGITPALQARMRAAVPCERVISMRTSHSPFLSQPQELCAHLLSIQ